MIADKFPIISSTKGTVVFNIPKDIRINNLKGRLTTAKYEHFSEYNASSYKVKHPATQLNYKLAVKIQRAVNDSPMNVIPLRGSPFYTVTTVRKRSCKSHLDVGYMFRTSSNIQSNRSAYIILVIPKAISANDMSLQNSLRMLERLKYDNLVLVKLNIQINKWNTNKILQKLTVAISKISIKLNIKPLLLISFNYKMLVGVTAEDLIQNFKKIYNKDIIISSTKTLSSNSTSTSLLYNKIINHKSSYGIPPTQHHLYKHIEWDGNIFIGNIEPLQRVLQLASNHLITNNLSMNLNDLFSILFIENYKSISMEIDYNQYIIAHISADTTNFDNMWTMADVESIYSTSTSTSSNVRRKIFVIERKVNNNNNASIAMPIHPSVIQFDSSTIIKNHFVDEIYNRIAHLMFYHGHYHQPIQLVDAIAERKNYRIVVSLTTVPIRLPLVELTIKSILSQSLVPDAIYLNIPKKSSRFRGEEYNISFELLSLPIIINRCEDYGPATKLIPTLEIETNPDTLIITVDDDMIFKSTLIRRLLQRHLTYPYAVYVNAGQMIDINDAFGPVVVRSAASWKDLDFPIDILEAFLGVIYRRDFFSLDILRHIPDVCRSTDDIWFSAHLARRGIPRVKVIQKPGEFATFSKNDNIRPLREGNVFGVRKNDMCAAHLLSDFKTMWSEVDQYCPFELIRNFS
eukprot:gene5635-11372_t